jgi:hypothetical protein
MRSRIGICAASTVLAACGLLLTGCGPDEASSADSPSSSADSSTGTSDGKSNEAGKGKENAGGSNGIAKGEKTSGGTGGSNQKPDQPVCTEKDTTVTVKTLAGSGKAAIELVNNSGSKCSVYGAPDVALKSDGDKRLNSKPAVDTSQKPSVVTLDANGGVASADLTYEGGPTDGITCGDEAKTAEVSTDDESWLAEIRVTKSSGSGDEMVVCDKKTTVSPFHS